MFPNFHIKIVKQPVWSLRSTLVLSWPGAPLPLCNNHTQYHNLMIVISIHRSSHDPAFDCQWEGLEMRPDIYGCLLQADGGSGDVFCQQTDYPRQRELIDSNMIVIHVPVLISMGKHQYKYVGSFMSVAIVLSLTSNSRVNSLSVMTVVSR